MATAVMGAAEERDGAHTARQAEQVGDQRWPEGAAGLADGGGSARGVRRALEDHSCEVGDAVSDMRYLGRLL